MVLSIEELEPIKDLLPRAIGAFKQKEKKLFFQDIRVDLGEGIAASAQDGNVKSARHDAGSSIGIRSYANVNGMVAAGQIGMQLGEAQFSEIGKIIGKLQKISFKRAISNAQNKARLKKKFPELGRSITSTKLAEVEICNDTIDAEFTLNPRDMPLEKLISRVEDCSKEVKKIPGIVGNMMYGITGLERQVFASSEGALIDSNKAFTQSFIFVTAKGKGTETFYEYNGEYAGPEAFDYDNPYNKSMEDFADFVAKGTVDVANSPAMKTTESEAVVITDPKYNALLSHEITGHPSEADRALKRESAWAGRAWWFRGIDDNEFGKKIGSEQLSVFSDPSLKGYGNYKYDDEGVRAKKVYHIKNGILSEFLNSRETAAVLNREPNGGMRASSADCMPLIRMNNTCIDKGEWKKEEIFEETRDGYYAVGQKTPSIGETRQNFKITCWKLYKIEKGEPTQLFRMGGLTGDSYSFFKSIDAVADDFALHNIPNCGKGTPMQTMRVGNGGPHLRGKAVVTGSHVVDAGSRDNVFEQMRKVNEINKQLCWWMRIF